MGTYARMRDFAVLAAGLSALVLVNAKPVLAQKAERDDGTVLGAAGYQTTARHTPPAGVSQAQLASLAG